MAVRDILLYPDRHLRQRCRPVASITDDVRILLDDLTESMYAAPGIGLAAPQVGSDLRAIVVDLGPRDESSAENSSRLYKLVNPEIVESHGTMESEEGCLSIPEIRDTIERHEEVVVEALDDSGKEVRLHASGLFSACLQHEIDHLDGILFIDRLSRVRREMVKSKLLKLERAKRRE